MQHISPAVAALSFEKKRAEETEVENNNDSEVPPQNSSAAGDDEKKSRDPMTSSDAERGDGGVDKRQDTGECPSTDEDAKTATADDDQADVQASTLPSDGTASPAADRKENSDKP